MQQQKLFQFPQILLLMILFSYLSFAAVIFTPAYPDLSKQFHLSDSQAQWMMTLFLLGAAFGRLPYGPLANRFGRKKILFLGLVISIVGTVWILAANSYALVCVGRLVQAIGCAVTLKISYTMIADLHAGSKATKALSYSMFVYAILPGIGTMVSGYLTPQYGWRGGFWFFLFFSILFTLSCLCLPETLKKKDLEALEIKKIAKGYSLQFKNPSLMMWSCLMALTTAVLFIFSQEAPFIAHHFMEMSPAAYGTFYLIPAFGIAGGSLFTAWLADRISPLNAVGMGIAIILLGTIAMGAAFLGKWFNGWALFIPQALIQFGDALVYTFASSQGLTEAKDKSNASSVILFISSLGAVVATFIAGVLTTRAPLFMPLIFIVITLIMLGICLRLRKRAKACRV